MEIEGNIKIDNSNNQIAKEVIEYYDKYKHNNSF